MGGGGYLYAGDVHLMASEYLICARSAMHKNGFYLFVRMVKIAISIYLVFKDTALFKGYSKQISTGIWIVAPVF